MNSRLSESGATIRAPVILLPLWPPLPSRRPGAELRGDEHTAPLSLNNYMEGILNNTAAYTQCLCKARLFNSSLMLEDYEPIWSEKRFTELYIKIGFTTEVFYSLVLFKTTTNPRDFNPQFTINQHFQVPFNNTVFLFMCVFHWLMQRHMKIGYISNAFSFLLCVCFFAYTHIHKSYLGRQAWSILEVCFVKRLMSCVSFVFWWPPCD